MFHSGSYKFFMNPEKNEVIAVATYAGRTVRGKAKCHPNDTFDADIGMELAKTRCALKIAKKRVANAYKCARQASDELYDARKRDEKMHEYFMDAMDEELDLEERLKELEKNI